MLYLGLLKPFNNAIIYFQLIEEIFEDNTITDTLTDVAVKFNL